MDRAELAERLVQADPDERAALLEQHAALLDVALARELKAYYDDTESNDPTYAARAADALVELAQATDVPEIRALAAWTVGMVALDNGRMEEAILHLDEAEAQFLALDQAHTAAATQVSKLRALAVLGRYDEALECGLRARDVFVAHGDMLSAGKIEQNLGNIYFRRDQYHEAEQFYRSARERFVQTQDEKQLAQINNCLATVLTWQHQFREAITLYEAALKQAESVGLAITQAEIECNIGCLALFQGRYNQALGYLEQSRRMYAALGMQHESAISEQELADAYLELNLSPEAAAIYERVIPTFAELGMRAEQARALAYYGSACLLLGQLERARALLAEARTLYEAEENAVGAAMVALIEAQAYQAEDDYTNAASAAARAEAVFEAEGAWGRVLSARWLRGEAARMLGQADQAHLLFQSTLRDAERYTLPQVAQRCHTSLGLLAAAEGNVERAEASFKRAVAIVEELRAPLPAEEFRTAFLADKLTPYAELVKLCLADDDTSRTAEALGYVERARSRALVDMLGGALEASPKPRDPFEAKLLAQLRELREELNWFYSQINRPADGEGSRSAAAMAALHQGVREREAQVLEINRQLRQLGGAMFLYVEPLDVLELRQALGSHTALVEYFSLDGEMLAFVVTDEQIAVIRHLAREEEVEATLEQLRFQVDALRYGAERLRPRLPQLALRARHYLERLYELLLQPLEEHLGARRLLVVPYRALHYVPFHALYDGSSYVIERREVCYVPSATVLRHCLQMPQCPVRRAVLLGVPDELTPRVRDEVLALAPSFPAATTLLDDQATLAQLERHAPSADVLHLACHGQFRPDNPLFSSLRLADGWLTVRDVYELDLHCEFVTLSACETGISALAPGDELIGLARGFFAAGAPALLVSLWAVDDEATAILMRHFYDALLAGARPAAALREAQCRVMQDYPHPYFWSPFALIGRW